MTERAHELVLPLSLKMKLTIATFLEKNLENDYTLSEVIDLIISSHVTSLVHVLQIAAKNHPKAKEDMKRFCDNLVSFIAADSLVKSMKMKTQTVPNE